jgi:peptidyl-prolyl cis-trans isomerase SurA
VREYLTKLRNEAYIDIRSDYVDSGATPNEQKIIQSAYAPPQAKKKKHEDRTRYRQIPVRGKKQTEKVSARGGAPAGVPTLDQVNGRQGKSAEVASGTQKPGKKEKIRFGQAPRETLPKGETRMVDAGAGPTQPSGSNLVALTNAQGDVIDTGAETQKKVKTRFSDRAREAKKKQEKEKAANKRQKFVPPTETPEQLAIDKQQQSALGLRGDTTHPKKANAAKTGPKRRFSDEDKKKQEPAQGSQSATPGTTTPAGTGGTGTNGTGTGGAGTAPPAAPQS